MRITKKLLKRIFEHTVGDSEPLYPNQDLSKIRQKIMAKRDKERDKDELITDIMRYNLPEIIAALYRLQWYGGIKEEIQEMLDEDA